MSFPPLFSSVQLAMRPGAIAALALNPGQVLTGRVTGRLPNGATLFQAGTHQLALQLQSPPAVGTVLNMRVDAHGGEIRLILVPPDTVKKAQPGALHVKSDAGPPPQAGNPRTSVTLPPAPPPPANQVPNSDPVKTVLSQMVQGALGRQASLAPVVQTIQALGPALTQMPEPVRRLATQLLASSLNLDTEALDGAALQKAVRQSGIFQEALLASGVRAGVGQGDIKANLQALSRVLRAWVGRDPQQTMPERVDPPQPIPAALRQPATLLLKQTDSALSQMTQGTAARQASTAQVLQTLQLLVPALDQMPETVRRIATRIVDRVTKAEALTPRSAISQAPLPTAAATLDTMDDLQALSRALRAWLQTGAHLGAASKPAPPTRGAPPRAPVQGAAVEEVAPTLRAGAHRLLEQTEDALSRIRLLQHASLPDEAVRGEPREWNLDLPFVFTGQPNVMPFQIQRDGGSEAEAGEQGWRVRFALNLGEMGEAGAQISLRGSRVSAMLWAAEPETARMMEEGLAALSSTLIAAGLNPGTLVCRHGVPEAPAPAPGGFVDATS